MKICTMGNCDNPLMAVGLCNNHYQQQWRAKNSDKVKGYIKNWYAANPEYGRSPEFLASQKEYQKSWRKANPGHNRQYEQRYHALKLGATVEHFKDIEIFERDQYICYLGGCVTDPTLPKGAQLRTVLEHRIPLSRGGEHSRANTATACWFHNSQKNNKTDQEWFDLQAITTKLGKK